MLNNLQRRVRSLMASHNSTAPASHASVDSRSISKRFRARLRLEDEGSNLVEFALVLPFMMALLTGILSFGSAMMNYEALSRAVGEGAQALVLSRAVTTDPCLTAFNAIKGAAPTLTPSAIEQSISFDGGTAITTTTCSGSLSLMKYGGTATVSAKYPCNIGVYGIALTPGCRLTATVTESEF